VIRKMANARAAVVLKKCLNETAILIVGDV